MQHGTYTGDGNSHVGGVASALHHPVRLKITDPEITPAGGPLANAGQYFQRADAPNTIGATGSVPSTGTNFFQSHKFALIVSAIVLCIFLVILVVHLTRRGGKKKKKIEPPPETEPAELEEMKKLQALRAARAGRPAAARELNVGGQSKEREGRPDPKPQAAKAKAEAPPSATAAPQTQPPLEDGLEGLIDSLKDEDGALAAQASKGVAQATK